MKRKSLLFVSVCVTALLLMSACTQDFPGYKKTAKGLYYKFYSQNPSATQPKLTDYMMIQMACYLNDSLYYDFQESGNNVFTQLKESYFSGDLEEAYAMMHVGDSASFYVKADSIAVRYYGIDPDSVGLKPGDYFRYEVKLLDVQTVEQLKAEADQAMLILKADSEKAFLDYIDANHITDHTTTGLFYKKLVTTKGKTPQTGQTAQIKYVVSYLDGTLLGTSDELGAYYEVPLGQHKVLRGLEEGIGLMRVGEKARFVLPYTLAYGEKAYQNIPAYSNLIFDVELLNIVNK
ncbi:MAG: FKBP-type peptidyl-prolyl cis-trans isomerase [Bacteroidales bacterium]|nr:FKBP-type peptidyl-prolyl cis-trans isomerase [Bacteroidales bacterium]